jgi:recombination protein RecT
MNEIVKKSPETYKVAFEAMLGEFKRSLPEGIPPERFVRICMTALSREPKLMEASVRSFTNAALQCASDGLVPDGKDAALVLFKSRDGGPEVVYMPMISGLVRVVHQSGKVKSIAVELVREHDDFHNVKGDDAEIRHEVVHWDEADRGTIVGGYAVIHMTNGGVIRETMSLAEIKKVQKSSRAGQGYSPWKGWWEEMARKSIFRRVSKWLPKSRETDIVAKSDHEFFDPAQLPHDGKTIDGEVVDLPEQSAPTEEQESGGGLVIDGSSEEDPPDPDAPTDEAEEPPNVPMDDVAPVSADQIMDSFESALAKKVNQADISKLIKQYQPSFDNTLLPPDLEDVEAMIAGAYERVKK